MQSKKIYIMILLLLMRVLTACVPLAQQRIPYILRVHMAGERTITVEYGTNTSYGFPEASGSDAMTAAVETQMNFIIQNALYFLANP